MDITEAFSAVPRTDFLPPEAVSLAPHDGPLAIGYGQTNSQPRTVADMLRLLEVHPGHRILDVGFGSGWTTALLAHLTGPQGQVFATELVPELVEFGRSNVAAYNYPNVDMRPALDHVFGLPDEGPFDRILVSAEATELPQELVEQLSPNGVMVIPVAGEMLRVLADASVTRHGRYRFVPLKRARFG